MKSYFVYLHLYRKTATLYDYKDKGSYLKALFTLYLQNLHFYLQSK
jgi:hypothetical protein